MGSLTDGERLSRRTVAPDRAPARAGRRREQHREPEHDRLQGRQRRVPRTSDAGRAREPVPRRRPPAQLRAGPRDLARSRARARCSRPAIRSTSRSATTPSSPCRRRAANATRATARCRSTRPASSSPRRACRCIGQNGPIVFQPNDRDVSISTDGTISVREGSNTTDSLRGKLRLASFDAAAAAAEGRHLDLHGAGRRAGADAAPTVRVKQGVDREVERAAASSR